MDYLSTVLDLVAGLVGFPALLAALINVAKRFGWIQDGQAPKVNMIAHLVAYIGVGVAVFLGKVDILPNVDVQLGAVAQLLVAVLAFLSSMSAAGKFHNGYVNAQLPGVGYSHSLKEAEALYGDDEDEPQG